MILSKKHVKAMLRAQIEANESDPIPTTCLFVVVRLVRESCPWVSCDAAWRRIDAAVEKLGGWEAWVAAWEPSSKRLGSIESDEIEDGFHESWRAFQLSSEFILTEAAKKPAFPLPKMARFRGARYERHLCLLGHAATYSIEVSIPQRTVARLEGIDKMTASRWMGKCCVDSPLADPSGTAILTVVTDAVFKAEGSSQNRAIVYRIHPILRQAALDSGPGNTRFDRPQSHDPCGLQGGMHTGRGRKRAEEGGTGSKRTEEARSRRARVDGISDESVTSHPRVKEKKPPHERWSRWAKKLALTISRVRKAKTAAPATWSAAFRELHEKDQMEIPRIRATLDAYCAYLDKTGDLIRSNPDKMFIAYSGPVFRKKFLDIEAKLKSFSPTAMGALPTTLPSWVKQPTDPATIAALPKLIPKILRALESSGSAREWPEGALKCCADWETKSKSGETYEHSLWLEASGQIRYSKARVEEEDDVS